MLSVAADAGRRPCPLKTARLIRIRLAIHDATMFSSAVSRRQAR
jgi:hypothetical protein